MAKSLHSICRWTFNAGKGGFVPADIRPDWAGDRFGTPEMIQLVADRIRPRLPRNVLLGLIRSNGKFEIPHGGSTIEPNIIYNSELSRASNFISDPELSSIPLQISRSIIPCRLLGNFRLRQKREIPKSRCEKLQEYEA